MCMIDDCDFVDLLQSRTRTARKTHRCSECMRTIETGESYLYEYFRFDGEVISHRTCRQCQAVRDFLQSKCGGSAYGFLREDIAEHGYYHRDAARMAVGMKWKWRTSRRASCMQSWSGCGRRMRTFAKAEAGCWPRLIV